MVVASMPTSLKQANAQLSISRLCALRGPGSTTSKRLGLNFFIWMDQIQNYVLEYCSIKYAFLLFGYPADSNPFGIST